MSRKICTKCGKEKELKEFYKDNRNRDGRGGQCKPCRQRVVRKWQENNYQTVLAASRRWKARNSEHLVAYSARWYAENKDLARAKLREWFKKNPHKNAYYKRIREARKRGAKGTFTQEQLKARLDFYGNRCWMCGGEPETIDHVIPYKLGGSNWPANLRPACRSCNSRKGTRSWKLFSGLV